MEDIDSGALLAQGYIPRVRERVHHFQQISLLSVHRLDVL